MSLPLTPAWVSYVASKAGLDVVHPEIRHDDGNWTVLIRFGGPVVRYFSARSCLRTRSVNIAEMGLGCCFTLWVSDEETLERCLVGLPRFVSRTNEVSQ